MNIKREHVPSWNFQQVYYTLQEIYKKRKQNWVQLVPSALTGIVVENGAIISKLKFANKWLFLVAATVESFSRICERILNFSFVSDNDHSLRTNGILRSVTEHFR